MVVMCKDMHHGICKVVGVSISASFFHSSSQQQLKIEIHLLILYTLQLEIINFLYKNLRKAAG
jgi:hypothetical protein